MKALAVLVLLTAACGSAPELDTDLTSPSDDAPAYVAGAAAPAPVVPTVEATPAPVAPAPVAPAPAPAAPTPVDATPAPAPAPTMPELPTATCTTASHTVSCANAQSLYRATVSWLGADGNTFYTCNVPGPSCIKGGLCLVHDVSGSEQGVCL